LAEADTQAQLRRKAGPGEAADEVPEWVLQVIDRAKRHLRGEPQDFADARLDWSRVGAFQRAVYAATVAVRAGTTATYGEIARAIALGPEGARAVGTALATNPWPLLVPCHRVVSAGDRMTGFSAPGGIRTKTRLLVLEGAELLSE
jgi:methylated-DNA-[protein]-cysteine S-methyltransferase